MPSNRCKQCNQPSVEIDHYSEHLTGCQACNRWQASTGEWCRLALKSQRRKPSQAILEPNSSLGIGHRNGEIKGCGGTAKHRENDLLRSPDRCANRAALGSD